MKRLLLVLAVALVFLSAPAEAASIGSPAALSAEGEEMQVAKSLVAEGRLAEAISLYERLLVAYPDNPLIYLEAFRAYRAAGKVNEALALADVARNRFREALMAAPPAGSASGQEAPRFVLHGKLSVGVMYDSNANQGPASDLMDLGNWKGVTVPGAKHVRSLAAYAGAELDAGYRLSPGGSWWVVGDASVYWRGNENDRLDALRSREWQQGRLAGGIRYLDSANLFDLRLKTEVFDYEFYNSVVSFGPEARYIRAVLPNLHLISVGNLDWRAYNRSSGRNGVYGSAGQFVRFIFGDGGHQFLIGGRYLGASADNHNYNYNGWQAAASFNLKLTSKFTVSPNVSYGEELYNGPATALETIRRKDKRWRAGIDLTYAINERWNIEAGYQYVDTKSTSNLYKYDQHVTRLGVSRVF